MIDLLNTQLEELKQVYDNLQKADGEDDIKFLARRTSLLRQMASIEAMKNKLSKAEKAVSSEDETEDEEKPDRVTVRAIVRKMGGDKALGTVAEQK